MATIGISGETNLPRGGRIYRPSSGGLYIVYNYGGLNIAFGFNSLAEIAQTNLAQLGNVVDVSAEQFHQMTHGNQGVLVASGAPELFGIAQNPRYRNLPFSQWLDDQLLIFSGGNKDLLKHDEVKRLMVLRATGNIVNDAELVAKVKQTRYWRSLTDAQRQWNDLSPAERDFQVDQAASQLANTWLNNVGSQITGGVANREIRNYATQIASGRVSIGYIIETWIKPSAKENPESPWSRQLREEQEQQRQRPIDIENMTGTVRDEYRRWGVQASDDTLRTWAARIVSKESSQEDLLRQLQQQAQVLYPWKPPEMDTATAAEPWIQTYGRVMERPTDLLNPAVQKALTAGMPVFEFEQTLKRDHRDEWMRTQNFRDSFDSTAATVGQKLGFV